MDISQWWPLLAPETRRWLIENNGDALRPEIAAEIARVGGSPDLADAEIDWIEAVANDEGPTID